MVQESTGNLSLPPPPAEFLLQLLTATRNTTKSEGMWQQSLDSSLVCTRCPDLPFSERKRHPMIRHLLGDGARVGGGLLPQNWILANSIVPGFDSLTSDPNKVDWTMHNSAFLWEGGLVMKSPAGLDKKRGETKKMTQRLTSSQPTLWQRNLCQKSGV